MLKEILAKLTEDKFLPIENHFRRQVEKLTKWCKALDITPDDYMADELSPLRTFLVSNENFPYDPNSYHFRFQGKVDPLGWRRYKYHVESTIELCSKMKQYITTRPQNGKEHMKNLHQYTWEYCHARKTMYAYSPGVYMAKRLKTLSKAFEEFESIYHEQWDMLKRRLESDYDYLKRKSDEDPRNLEITHCKNLFEETFEDGLEETENILRPNQLKDLEDKANQLETKFTF